MFEQLLGVENRFEEIEKRLSDPQVVQDRQAYEKYSREHAELSKVVSVFRNYKQVLKEMDDSLELLKDGDPEIKALARDEMETLEELKTALEKVLSCQAAHGEVPADREEAETRRLLKSFGYLD